MALGLGNLVKELGGAFGGLPGAIGSLAPGGKKSVLPEMLRGAAGSLASTALEIPDQLARSVGGLPESLAEIATLGQYGGQGSRKQDTDSITEGLRSALSRRLGVEAPTFNASVQERGALPVAYEQLGNILGLKGAIKAPGKIAKKAQGAKKIQEGLKEYKGLRKETAEQIARGELPEEYALPSGRQVLTDRARSRLRREQTRGIGMTDSPFELNPREFADPGDLREIVKAINEQMKAAKQQYGFVPGAGIGVGDFLGPETLLATQLELRRALQDIGHQADPVGEDTVDIRQAKAAHPAQKSAFATGAFPEGFSEDDFIQMAEQFVQDALRSQGVDPSALAGGVAFDPEMDPEFAGYYDPSIQGIRFNRPEVVAGDPRGLQRIAEHETAHAAQYLGGKAPTTLEPPPGFTGFSEAPGVEGQGPLHDPTFREIQQAIFSRPGGAQLEDLYLDPEARSIASLLQRSATGPGGEAMNTYTREWSAYPYDQIDLALRELLSKTRK